MSVAPVSNVVVLGQTAQISVNFDYNERDKALVKALARLIEKGEEKRLWRACSRPMIHFRFDGTAYMGICDAADGGTHTARINLLGHNSFNCTCPDRANRGEKVGPCKHVLSLAIAAINNINAFYTV